MALAVGGRLGLAASFFLGSGDTRIAINSRSERIFRPLFSHFWTVAKLIGLSAWNRARF
jgi:hypothetical protein